VIEEASNPDRRMTIVVHRERCHFYPAHGGGRGEWVEVGRLAVSAWDNEALLCFADDQITLLTMDGQPVEFGADGHEMWGACAGQIVSETGELALAVVSDDGHEITYSVTAGAA
jgi:hypothetical protein